MGRIGWQELLLIAFIVLLLFGAKNLPEIGKALGQAIKEFRKIGKDIEDDMKDIDQGNKRSRKS